MANIIKPTEPTYVTKLVTYRVMALCKSCGAALPAAKSYCPACHDEKFREVRQCLYCSDTFTVAKSYARKYCEKHRYGKKDRPAPRKRGPHEGVRDTPTLHVFLNGVGKKREVEMAREAGVSRQAIHQLEKKLQVCHLDPWRRKSQ